MTAIIGGGTGFLSVPRAAGMALRAVLTHHPAASRSELPPASHNGMEGKKSTQTVVLVLLKPRSPRGRNRLFFDPVRVSSHSGKFICGEPVISPFCEVPSIFLGHRLTNLPGAQEARHLTIYRQEAMMSGQDKKVPRCVLSESVPRQHFLFRILRSGSCKPVIVLQRESFS